MKKKSPNIKDKKYCGEIVKKIREEKKETATPIVVFDLRVAVFNILPYYENIVLYHKKETAKTWLRCAWSLYFNRGFTGAPYFSFTLAVVDDYPPYWRAKYLKERGFPTYKGNRKEKPNLWEKVYQGAIDYITQPMCPYHYLRYPRYEADDIASAITRLSYSYERDIYLYTIDSDWHGLVNYDYPEDKKIEEIFKKEEKKKVVWLNMAHWLPRIRGNQQVINHTRKRLKREIKEPRQIWEVKQEQGDKADNLIANSPIEVISLLELPEEHDILKNPEYDLALTRLMEDNKEHNNLEHLEKSQKWFEDEGLSIPMLDYYKFPI